MYNIRKSRYLIIICCESYHSRLNRRSYNINLNIFNFVDQLLEVRSEPKIKLRSTNKKIKHARYGAKPKGANDQIHQ